MIIDIPAQPPPEGAPRLATRRERARSGRFVAEGEDLVRGRRARPAAHALEGFRVAGPELGDARLPRRRARRCCARVSTLGSGTRVIGVYEQRWSRARRAAVRVPARRRRSRQRRHGAALGARVRRRRASRSGPAAPIRTRRRRCARAWARSSPSRSRASSDVGELPGERVALVRRRARGARATPGRGASGERRRRPRTRSRCWSAPSATGCPRRSLAACERSARIPIAAESLNAAMAATVALYEVTRDGRARVI